METQVRTPQTVFMHPQRLTAPLFQRPYVWNEENQWEPLWNHSINCEEKAINSTLLAERYRVHGLVSGDRYGLSRKVVRTLGIKRIKPVVISEKCRLIFAYRH